MLYRLIIQIIIGILGLWLAKEFVPGVNFERVLKDKNSLYTDISESQFRNFKKNKDLLSSGEMKILQEIAEIKRREKADWGM